MTAAPVHAPVMVKETTDLFVGGGVELLLDATVGAGGHSAAFLAASGPNARVVGLDRDPEMAEIARERLAPFGERARVVARSFADLEAVLDDLGIDRVDGVLFDLGASSVHFDRADRGFSFLSPGPLDMRFDRTSGETAADLVNRLPEAELASILREHGDEPRAKAIARAIVAARPIRDTLRLAETVERAVGGARGRAHPATRTFQALRIRVNREHEAIESATPAAIRRLRPGGRLAAITFHSGEDRLVKRLLREAERAGLVRPLAKKPIEPSAAETAENPRARSARLRAAERTDEEAR